MKKIKVGVNGVGRIGRCLIREWYDRNIQDFEIVAVNNPGTPDVYTHLLKYDSNHGPYPHSVKWDGEMLNVGDARMHFFSERQPADIPWDKAEVDVVIDSTGKFKTAESLSAHIKGNVKKVILCAPGEQMDLTTVMGINQNLYDPKKHHIISNASCTTNCLAPVVSVLQDNWEIEHGMMSTVHAYTADQKLLDGGHKDLRRARGAAQSIIPTSTGAAKALGEIFPELQGKLDGLAWRVPTPNVSVVDLTVHLKRPASIEEINERMELASKEHLKGILKFNHEKLVSIDFLGTRESSIFDATLTNVIGNVAKVVAWYDNETGFSNRVLDLAIYISNKLSV